MLHVDLYDKTCQNFLKGLLPDHKTTLTMIQYNRSYRLDNKFRFVKT